MVAEERENPFPFVGRNCDIGFLGKWKEFSPRRGKAVV
jgi:hypothetical protein